MFQIKGRFALTRDPILKTTPNGTVVANGGAADNYTEKGSGEKITTFLELTAWKEVAEKLVSFKKGEIVEIEGYFQRKPWTDKNGNSRDTFQVTVNAVEKYVKSAPAPAPAPTPASKPSVSPAPQAPQFVDIPDDDLPF